MGAVVAGIVGLVVLILNLPPASKVVLLPDVDGKTGALLVTASGGAQELSSAYRSAHVDTRGAIKAQTDPADQVTQTYAATLAARPKAPVSFVLYFESGSSVDIAPAFKPVLEQLLSALSSFPAPEVTVIGHTDRVGSVEANDLLALQRAQTVRDLILQSGISVPIDVSGRGERETEVPTADETPEPRNRRVEINLR